MQRLNFFGGPALNSDELGALQLQEGEAGHAEDRIVVGGGIFECDV